MAGLTNAAMVNRMERHEMGRVEMRNWGLALGQAVEFQMTGLAAFKETVAEPVVEFGDGFDFVGGLLDVVLDADELDLSW